MAGSDMPPVVAEIRRPAGRRVMSGTVLDGRVTLALFTFNQEPYVREAVRAVLAQDYSPLDIIISDDASTDDTFRILEDELQGYDGPHRIRLNRNARNLGVGEHVNLLAGMSNTNFIVLAAGDDIALPQR